uniref:Uncharacterized protein n=1 Tax=Panagrellus redivivus TaxID=6233 RepID=A0A7E4VSL5_PANRE
MLPYAFRKRLVTLAPTRIVDEFNQLCKNDNIQAYDHVFITDNIKVFKWASKDTFLFRVFKFLHQFAILRFFLDGSNHTNPMWEAVVHVRDIRRSKQNIYVDETLVLYCNSISGYDYVIPYIRGPYTRLILHGNIRWDQVMQLIHPGVTRVRINATIQMPIQYYDVFAEFIAKHFHGFNSCFVMFNTPIITYQLRERLREVCERLNHLYEFIGGPKERISISYRYNDPCYFVVLSLLSVWNILVLSYIIDSIVVVICAMHYTETLTALLETTLR